MRTEARLFTGVAAFFGAAAGCYGPLSGDPAGTAALVVAFLMAALVAFFLHVQYRKRGRRPQDRPGADVADGAGPLEFMPPSSPWPVVTAAGFALAGGGVVYGLWLFLIGAGVLAAGVLGLVFQYAARLPPGAGEPDGPSETGSRAAPPGRG
ncbi:cytochrome c oxidase subunit 4 [Streptomyces sp. B1866]|uniref:aa3-type cytochrome oxidase subunit IV n=1 Tax=Streptomyces sp. B1866 TaxID=3075431 RepID=UPI00289264FC|nr:cytochrome c oxidase subunit 4 [Streptomyces sp. B1866]MDT3397120.1 cytochrome c oxidase subunit 4 [Streptomyces sp. B1866]